MLNQMVALAYGGGETCIITIMVNIVHMYVWDKCDVVSLFGVVKMLLVR